MDSQPDSPGIWRNMPQLLSGCLLILKVSLPRTPAVVVAVQTGVGDTAVQFGVSGMSVQREGGALLHSHSESQPARGMHVKETV